MTTPAPHRIEAATSTAALVFCNPNFGDGDAISITDLPFTIGRAPENILSIDNATVSREHAVIERLNGVYVMYDNGSKNRTMIVWEGFDPVPGIAAGPIDKDVVVLPFDSMHLTPWPHRPNHCYDAGYLTPKRH